MLTAAGHTAPYRGAAGAPCRQGRPPAAGANCLRALVRSAADGRPVLMQITRASREAPAASRTDLVTSAIERETAAAGLLEARP